MHQGTTTLEEGGSPASPGTTTPMMQRSAPNGHGNTALQGPFLQTQARSRIALLRAPAAVEGGAGLGCAGMGGRGSAMTASSHGAWHGMAWQYCTS